MANSSVSLTYLTNLVVNVAFSLPDSMVFKMSSLSIEIVFGTELPEGKDATTNITAGVNVLGGRSGLKSFKAGAMGVLKAVRRDLLRFLPDGTSHAFLFVLVVPPPILGPARSHHRGDPQLGL